MLAPMTPAELADLLGTGTFRYRMGLRALDDLGGFLRAHRDPPAAELARRQVFEAHPGRCGFAPGVDEAASLRPIVELASRTLGRELPARLPDLSLGLGVDLMEIARADLRLVAIAVAFPSGWAPEDALGRETGAIHAIVPGLEPALGASIARFLEGLAPGRAYERTNVGLSLGDALDRHPRAGAPRIEADSDLGSLHLRIEHQAFVGLDDAHLLFLVAIRHELLEPLLAHGEARRSLRDFFASMPDEVARYKGVAKVRARLLARLA